MPWIRLSDNYIDHPKFVALSHGSFRLWHEGMAFTRKHQTDGLLPFSVVRSLRHHTKGREKQLTTPYIPNAAPLWEVIPATGYKIHDYLDWNLSKEEENQQRVEAKNRMALSRDTDLRNALRRRDGECCRYCGDRVSWTDRRGPKGATYDHVVPGLDNTIENLVVACRGCNSRKGGRTPEQAGMPLLPPRSEPVVRTDLDRIQNGPKSNLSISGLERRGNTQIVKDEEGNDAIDERAGRLLQELYPGWYAKWRNGARLRLIANPLAFQDAVSVCRLWDDARIEKLARIVLTTDDQFISGTDRSFRIFAMKASWADDRLRQAESGAA